MFIVKKMEELLKQHFFVLEEKDKTFSAFIRFGGFKTYEEAQFLIDSIILELGMVKTETSITYH